LEFLKIQDGGGHLENHKNNDIFTTVRRIFTKFGTVMHTGPQNLMKVKVFIFHKLIRWTATILFYVLTKTANTNINNCSLSIALTATDQTPQKSLKR